MTTTAGRRRRTALRIAFAGSLGLLPMLLAGGGARAATPSLGGWNVSADGNAVDIVLDNTTGLAGVHPFSEADFPEAESQFETGPFGSGLATVFWPGAPGGDFGSLSAELGIPAQLEPYLSKLNDPARASTQYPSGPTTSSYPAGAPNGTVEMTSQSDATSTTATSAINDVTEGHLLGFSSAKGTSESQAVSTAAGNSSTDLSGVSLLGGLVGIGSITSTATASSNGHSSSGSSVTHVSGVTVLGLPASIGSDGLVLPHLPTSSGPLGGVVSSAMQTALQETISGLGLRVTELPSERSVTGASTSVTSGAVQIEVIPPPSAATTLETAASVLAPLFPSQAAIIPTLPGLLQGATLTITLGRATASADASPAFTFAFTPLPFPAVPAYGSGTAGSSSSSSVSPVATSPGASSPTGGATVAAGSAATPVPASSTQAAPPEMAAPQSTGLAATAISLSTPLRAGAVVVGLLAMAAIGYGLWRVARLLLPEDTAPICPLGRENP